MGLTMAGLAARPQLAKQLVTHHLVLAFPPDAQQALLEGRLTAVPTLAAGGGGSEFNVLKVTLRNAVGQQQQQQVLHITDTQGQTVVAVKVVQIDANKVAVIIDKVLMSGWCRAHTSLADCWSTTPLQGPLVILLRQGCPHWLHALRGGRLSANTHSHLYIQGALTVGLQ